MPLHYVAFCKLYSSINYYDSRLYTTSMWGLLLLSPMVNKLLTSANEPNEADCFAFSLLAHLLSRNTELVCLEPCDWAWANMNMGIRTCQDGFDRANETAMKWKCTENKVTIQTVIYCLKYWHCSNIFLYILYISDSDSDSDMIALSVWVHVCRLRL